MKVVTSYTHLVTGEGDRLSYTYSEIDDQGNLISQNQRGNFIVTDQALLGHVQAINTYITQNKLED